MTKEQRFGLYDELVKISEAQPGDRRKALKRVLKGAALVAAGTGAGYLAGGALDYGLQKGFGSSWQNLNQSTKMKIIGTAMGLASTGIMVGTQFLEQKRREEMQGHE